MADTYSQIYIQLVFATQYRAPLIDESWEDELYKYMTGIVQGKGQKLLAINGMPDHVHILIGMKPTCCLSDLVREVKKSSNQFIYERGFCPRGSFQWQPGFGAFSYSYRSYKRVAAYIANQKAHHRKRNFKAEYLELLKKFEVEYRPEYLFEFYEPE